MNSNKFNSDFFSNDDKDKRNGSSGGGSNGPRRFNFFLLFLILIGIICFSQFFLSIFNSSRTDSYTKFMQFVEADRVSEVTIVGDKMISYRLLDGRTGSARIPYVDFGLVDKLMQHNIEVNGKGEGISWFDLLINILPLLLIVYILISFSRQAKGGSNAMFGNLGQNLAREYKPGGKDAITFKDVAGQKEAKEELQEVVEFLKNPKKFSQLGAKIPKGVLLVGPPGTGKTLIARAVAGESGVYFLHTSGSDFVEMFVGMGAARVRDLFNQARKKSPCIIFIDELDAVGRSRGSGIGGGHDEREQTLNQLLVEMDGFDTAKGIIVIAATNRVDVLDNALLRPGRFDRQVAVELPDVKEREAILKLHFEKVKTDGQIDFSKIARATAGASGADLANLANESALLAARYSKPYVTMAEVEQARDKIVLGTARTSRVMSPEAKTATAYHEAGHTLLHYYVKGVDPLHKVTIIPHGQALGLTISLPEEDILTRNKESLEGWIKICMGGYAAEELVYGQTTTGTSNDIKQATNVAHRMVTEWGMSSLGFVNYSDDDHPLFLGRDINQRKNFSDETAKIIDEEERKILDSCLKEVRQILSEHKDQLDLITQNLVEKETLDDNDIRDLLGLEHVQKQTDL